MCARKFNRFIVFLAWVGVGVFAAQAPARAHHVVSESGIAWVEPVTAVEVEGRAARFDFGEYFRGRWTVVTPSVEVAPLPWLSLSGRAPIAHIWFDDGRQVVGLGDVEVAAKARVLDSEHGAWLVSVGLGAELPTGVVADGLGGGHVELSPFVAASAQPHQRLILSALVADRLSLGQQEAPHSYRANGPHGALIAPHSPHELFTRLSASAILTPRAYATLGLDHVSMFAAADRGRGPWSARAEAGWAEPGAWRVALGAELPWGYSARSGLITRLSAAWMF